MKKKVLAFLLAAAMLLALSACGGGDSKTTNPPATKAPATQAPEENNQAPEENNTPDTFGGEVIADFANGADPTGNVFASDGWSNGSVFDTFWKSDCLTYSDGQMHLSIKDANGEVDQTYYSGEARTNNYYGYGDFAVSMKPAKAEGTASTFFTCTGPYDINANGEENPWDEIDIEFLGKDTTGVQFNYFVNGQGGHEYWYELGFDASEDFHEYGFRWTEDSISWYVDGQPVYTVTTAENGDLPKTAGRILCNFWAGTKDAEGWMGPYTLNEATADYKYIKTSAVGAPLIPEEGGEGESTAIPTDGLKIDFSQGMPENGAFFPSDGWSNGSVFNTFWKGDMAYVSDGVFHLGIKDANGEVEQGYYSGEGRTALHYGFGSYRVSMKPAKVEGTASTFFTCTGNYDIGLDGNPNPWDEIDIEFLGKDTTGVQFNYFVDGRGGHEHWIDLGFDASEAFHEYGFDWTEDSITWFVDGKPVYTVTEADNGPLPKTNGRILTNYWCGTPDAEGWMGKYTLSDATADYQWISTTATGVDLQGGAQGAG